MTTEELAVKIPTEFYIVVGTFIVANLGAILTFFWGGIKLYGKAIEWKTSMEHRVSKNEKDINNAWTELRTKQDKTHA